MRTLLDEIRSEVHCRLAMKTIAITCLPMSYVGGVVIAMRGRWQANKRRTGTQEETI